MSFKFYSVPLIMLALVFMYVKTGDKGPYGNNEASIIQVIRSIDGYTHGFIELLEIKDIQEDRVAVFLFNGSPAYIHFSKNQDRNYKWW